jgi:hypothetical protein
MPFLGRREESLSVARASRNQTGNKWEEAMLAKMRKLSADAIT